jgi:hypothetical protein
MHGKGETERRKEKRYQVKKGAFAALRPLYEKIGRVTNISQGGLAFRYMDTGSQEKGTRELDIFMISNAFRLDRIAVRIISDLNVPKKPFPGSLSLRHCRVEFGELNPDQAVQLDYFIRNYTLLSHEHADQGIQE